MSDIRVQDPQGQFNPARGSARGAVHVKDPPRRYLGYEHVTSTAATAKTLTPRPSATYADIHVTAADIYWALSRSVTPAAGVGDEAAAESLILLHGASEIAGFSAVRQTTDFTLKVSYYAEGDYDEEA